MKNLLVMVALPSGSSEAWEQGLLWVWQEEIAKQAGWGRGLVGPLFLTGLWRGPHASRPPLPFSEDTRAPSLLQLHSC